MALRVTWQYIWLVYGTVNVSVGLVAPLLIIRLGGGPVEVGVSEAVFMASLSLGSLVWGRAVDVTPFRKPFLYAGALTGALSMLVISTSTSVVQIVIGYALAAQSLSVTAIVMNMLVIENAGKDAWGAEARRGFLNQILGSSIGIALGYVTTKLGFGVREYGVALALASLSIIPISFYGVVEPPFTFERRTLLLIPRLSFYKLYTTIFYPKRLRDLDLKLFSISALRVQGSEFLVLLVASSLFMFSTKMFFTVYIPFLKAVGVTDSDVISVFLVTALMNTLATLLLSDELEKGDYKLVSRGMGLRAVGMLMASVFTIYLRDYRVVYSTMLSFSLIAFAYSVIALSLQILVYKSLPAEKRGGGIGVYSAVNSLSLFLGSLSSGFMASTLGYHVVYFVGALLLLLSSALIEHHYRRRATSEWVEVL